MDEYKSVVPVSTEPMSLGVSQLQDYLGGSDKVQTIIRQFLGEDKAKAASKGYVELHGGSTRQVWCSVSMAAAVTLHRACSASMQLSCPNAFQSVGHSKQQAGR